MITSKKSTYYLRLFLDLLILNISFFVAAILSQSFKILLQRNYMFILMTGLNFVWYFVSNVIEFYEDFNTRNFSYQFIKIFKNIIVQVLTAVLFIFLVKEDLFTRNFIILYALLLTVLVSIRTQIIKHTIARVRGKEKNIRNVLIIGAGELGRNFFQMINKSNDFGFNLVGFLDDAKDNPNDMNIIGTLNEIDKILPEKKVEEVVIALPIYAANQLDEIIKVCNRNAVRVHIIPDYFRYLSKKFQINMMGNFPIITVRGEPLSEFHWRFVKRTFDIIFSLLAIVLILSWLYPLLFILNKIYSPGPVMFVQDRVGAKDKIFKCYKFRTMHVGNRSINKYQPTTEEDSRITRVGKFLRKSNVDELPQFINVLKGDMSIVGPRPHPIAFHEIYKEMVDEIKIRSWVKPGITGWAQIHGYRGDVPDYEENKKRTIKRIEYDLWYIENWSSWLDVQIILTTVWQMVKGDTKGI
ncbi:MAG: undecaprenyl-phosphate glucose phosphotransferase [Bacteroidetes bacterium]|nr:undecaprenyl-phosphate glucose phosphotransferase [Bacteroidota bacterium]